MAKYRFHKIAAVVVLIGFAAWMATGKFSSVGSASAENETAEKADAAKKAAENKPVLRTVAVMTPPRIGHARAIRISGQTQADKRAVLATRAAGIIAELPVKEGDRVKAGDLILRLESEEKPAAVETAMQLVKQREAELEASQQLSKSGNLAKLQLTTAVSALAQARAQLETARAELERTRIVAPFDGIVDDVTVELGSSVPQGGDVATMLSLDPVVVRGEISERDLSHIKIGDKAEATLVDGAKVDGSVRYISREATAATRTYRVEIQIPNPEGRIPAGMTAELTLRSAPVDAVALPRSVVTLSATGDLGIRAVDSANKVVFFPIDLVDDTPTGLLLAGIPADARVIMAGQDLVKEGDEVKPVAADPAMIQKLAQDATGTQ
ncbi:MULTISPECIES: efflux RND transporter periplasmic adaptor subunit [Mesorhizobium]|uniref:Efflux RND transporter periplasmic adaptor subunit n=1 Tax=Mesorhizobium denitrificans TaxID=2294114 RepID=A0A371XEQ9_9HYPH|nr:MULTISPECIES: efflux RND transporter periplasmic adaptor subunit [Mesorhizobium]RFC67717.1 efflux RND transporter periplasmic adaptor subunit [Mesorhizobium denitrificans]